MKVYIAGPMTGYPEHNFPAFDAARNKIISEGNVPVSPADISRANVFPGANADGTITAEAYCFFVKLDFIALLECDEVLILEGWAKSRGAKLEIAVAQACGIPIKHFDNREALLTKVSTVIDL